MLGPRNALYTVTEGLPRLFLGVQVMRGSMLRVRCYNQLNVSPDTPPPPAPKPKDAALLFPPEEREARFLCHPLDPRLMIKAASRQAWNVWLCAECPTQSWDLHEGPPRWAQSPPPPPCFTDEGRSLWEFKGLTHGSKRAGGPARLPEIRAGEPDSHSEPPRDTSPL